MEEDCPNGYRIVASAEEEGVHYFFRNFKA